jgi:hypothetical protein
MEDRNGLGPPLPPPRLGIPAARAAPEPPEERPPWKRWELLIACLTLLLEFVTVGLVFWYARSAAEQVRQTAKAITVADQSLAVSADSLSLTRSTLRARIEPKQTQFFGPNVEPMAIVTLENEGGVFAKFRPRSGCVQVQSRPTFQLPCRNVAVWSDAHSGGQLLPTMRPGDRADAKFPTSALTAGDKQRLAGEAYFCVLLEYEYDDGVGNCHRRTLRLAAKTVLQHPSNVVIPVNGEKLDAYPDEGEAPCPR